MPDYKISELTLGTLETGDFVPIERNATDNYRLNLKTAISGVVTSFAASATASGLVELATDAETLAGVDTVRAITAANLAAKLASPGPIGTTVADAVYAYQLRSENSILVGTAGDLGGRIYFYDDNTFNYIMLKTNGPTADRQINLPDNNGTLALLTDISGSIPTALQFAITDETTAATTGSGKITFRMPYAMTLTSARLSLNVAPTGGPFAVDIWANPLSSGGTGSIFGTGLTIDSLEKTSVTANTGVSIAYPSLLDDAEMSIHINQVGSTYAGAGAKVTLIGLRAV